MALLAAKAADAVPEFLPTEPKVMAAALAALPRPEALERPYGPGQSPGA